MMRIRRAVWMCIIALIPLFIGSTALANSNDPPLFTLNALNPYLSYAVPTSPMHGGSWELKIAPGVYSQSAQGMNASARGGAVSATHGFSDHWGISAVFATVKMSGSSPIDRNLPNSQTFQSPKFPAASCGPDGCSGGGLGGDISGHGLEAGIAMIYDPTNGDGFRLPMLLGVDWLDVTGNVDNTSLGLKRTATNSGPAVSIGIEPQFNAWRFRLSPFVQSAFLLNKAKSSVVDYNPTTGAVNSRQDFQLQSMDYRQTHAIGMAFTYRPWNLGFTYVLADEGESSYILSYTKKWGGPNGVANPSSRK